MKTSMFSQTNSLLAAGTTALMLFLASTGSAKIFDGGIDSENMGKGDHIYVLSYATNKLGGNVLGVTDIPSLMSYERNQGMNFIVVKAATGSTNYPSASNPQFTSNLVYQAHLVGLKIIAYTRSYGDDIAGEIKVASDCYKLGADGFMFDAEGEWESSRQGTAGPTKAWDMLAGVKTNYPTKLLVHAPFLYITSHSSFPWKEFGYWCDCVMPQVYWQSFGITPAQGVTDLDTQWNNWQNGLSGMWTNAIKPLAPIGQADNAAIPAAEVTAFVDALKASTNPATLGGYKGVSWWRADLHTNGQWAAIAASGIGTPTGLADIIVDNTAATVVGTWTTASSANDRYGADYRYKGQGTGAAYLQFNPTVTVPGNYKTFIWYPAGSNRTTNAPVMVSYSGGTANFVVNQRVTGGSWRYLGTFPYDAGTNAFIKISDATPDAGQLVMADAVMLQYVLPPPAAPSGLSATAASGPVINLAWTDNSSDELSFSILRSTVSGGPYTEVGSTASGVTTFSDTSLSASTTYYYVVRAVNSGGPSANSNEASATSTDEVADIIIDNTSAGLVGSWTLGTSSTDKYGADYYSRSKGTGANSATYLPNILTPGTYRVYEWHPQGGNRTTVAPHIITHAAGRTTNYVNQQTGGGKWNLIGTYDFAAGASGSVKITDGFTDSGTLVMADAIKFSYGLGTTAPAAPSAVVATAINQGQIDLSWTDNSTDEDSFTVSRSITAGGPYTDIAMLPANSTNYSSAGLSPATTYYFVVRASNAGGSSSNSIEAAATTLPDAPATPSALVATAISQTQIDLSWTDNANNEDNVIVARATTAGGPYTDIATLGANTASYSDTSLTANTAYYYIVRSVNIGGASANSAEATAMTLPNPPAAPSGLVATVVSQTEINLAWADNADNEDNLIVGRSAVSGGPYADMATLPANAAAYSDSGLTANTTYYYVVRAKNTGGESANCLQASATTLPNAPTAPVSLSASTVSQTQINLTWADTSDNEDNFMVGRSLAAGGPYADIATLPANATAYTDSGLTAATTYYYVVRAKNTGGESANSAPASETTLPNPPAAPSGLVASTVSQTAINLAWADNAVNEVSFIVARGIVSGGPYADIATLPANSTTYSDSGLTANATYFYVVRAVNTGGTSANCPQASATTLPNPPVAPTALAATVVSQTQVNLSWTDNSSNEDNFIIARSDTAGGPYTDIATLSANTTSYSNTGLTAGTTYFYVVRAANLGGTSPSSAEASATTLPNAPAAPSALTAIGCGASRVNLTWTDNSSNESSFIIGRSATSGGPYADIATVAANTTAYTAAGLTANTTYYFVVRASNAGGASANAAQASAVTAEADLIIDNKAALVVGSWSSGTSSTDKYGADYRYKSQGTGAAYLQFTPYIATTGVYEVYEWHPQGANRETNAPHIITYSSGSVTNYVNQRINGGKWNLLGTYSFAQNAGSVRISDKFTSTNSLMADAIKLVYITPPAAPSGLIATAASSSQINLSWADNSTNETGFVVARSSTAGGPYTDIATLAANSTTYNNTGLAQNTTYYYVVRSTGAGGGSANTAEASATTLPTPPAAPSGLTATTISQTQINLTWVDNSSNESSFIIGRATVSGGPYTDIATLGANTTSYNNTGLPAGTTYYYVVRASNAGGASANSAQASATTLQNPPAAPSGLTATAVSSSQINLAWTDNSSNETNFIVARSAVSGGPYTDIVTLAANTTSYSNTGLAQGTTYYYVVRATNNGGSSANSAQASATTLTLPAAPSGLTAAAVSSGQINLTWIDNASNESAFVIARGTTSGGPYTDVGSTAANITAFSNTGLAASTTYYYVVRATNAAGASANSPQASATTLPSPPSPPGGLAATAVSSSQIDLVWTDNAANETNMIVARATVSGGPYTDIATLPANSTSYSNTGLAASTTYYYVVRAVNAGGASPNSNQAGATTQVTAPAAPSGLTATALSSSSIKLAWTDNSSNESNFVVARGTTTGGPYTDIATLGANVTVYTNTALAANTTYYYVVRATNAGGSSANSAQASATTLSAAPAAPSGLTATALSPTSIKLAWTDNSSNESNFIVGRSPTSGGPYTDIATLAANTVTYTNTALTPNTTYYFVVRATNAGGSSANSAQASATTQGVADIIVDNVAAAVTGTWSTGTTATDKYSTDYRYKSKGTGTAYLTFRPNVQVAGNYTVYEWHAAGSNRTTNAPVILSYNGGSRTNYVNQQVNGGSWVGLGAKVSFAAGTNGYVRITDNCTVTGAQVMADAIKLVYTP